MYVAPTEVNERIPPIMLTVPLIDREAPIKVNTRWSKEKFPATTTVGALMTVTDTFERRRVAL